jgi:predicted nucleic acid-binding protein
MTSRRSARGFDTTAVLRERWPPGTISDQRFAVPIDDLEDLDLDRYPTLHFMRPAYELRANLTAYDGAYGAIADGLLT